MADEEQFDKYNAIKNALHQQEEQQYKPHSSKKKKGKKKKRKRRTLGQRIAGLFPQHGDSIFEVFRKMIFLASSMVFVVCLALIGKYFWENHQNALVTAEAQRIHDSVIEPERHLPKEPGSPEIEEEERYELLESAKNLLAINKDVVGYLSIPDEPRIAYPVLQRRNAEDGNSYYLDKNINLEYAKAGSIFMDYRDYFDDMVENFDDTGEPDGTYHRTFPNSQNLVIYGHNMHDFSMFGALKYYINTESYYEKHAIIELESNYMKYRYKVFGMIVVDVDDETDTRFEYWNTINFENEEKFYEYVNEIKRRTLRTTEVDVKYGDQLLTLSTCNGTFDNGRLVICARLLREGEDPAEGCVSAENPNIKWSSTYYKWHRGAYDPDAEFIPYG